MTKRSVCLSVKYWTQANFTKSCIRGWLVVNVAACIAFLAPSSLVMSAVACLYILPFLFQWLLQRQRFLIGLVSSCSTHKEIYDVCSTFSTAGSREKQRHSLSLWGPQELSQLWPSWPCKHNAVPWQTPGQGCQISKSTLLISNYLCKHFCH